MFKYGALFGWGIVIYAIVFLVWSGFIAYGFVEGLAPTLMSYLVLVVVAAIAGNSLHLRSWKDILPYSLAWAAFIAILDAVFAVPFTGWGIYSDPNVLMGYFLVIVVPLFTCEMTVLERDRA
ncbi:MAG: hypothetical protein Q7S05_02015 [bacterium]|nr:hypothetical protein [bacterium]